MILRVASTNLSVLWEQVAPLVQSALRDCQTHDVEDVRAALLAGTSTLFIQMEDNQRVDGLCIANFAVFPKGIWVHI